MSEREKAIEFHPNTDIPTEDFLREAIFLGRYGRLVGWGIWQEMNMALRDLTPREAAHLALELPLLWRGFRIHQSGKVRWSIEKDGCKVVIWDLWNWVKRPPHQEETARALYLAIQSTGKKMGVKPRGYFGNGNLATPILRAQGISLRLPSTEVLPENLTSRAFYGGRIQSIRIGRHIGPVYEYDLNSAYAWGLSQLPEIIGIGKPEGYCPWRLIEVEWRIPRQKVPIYPFPVRDKEGRVHYPRIGRGWHWSPLVAEAEKFAAPFIRRLQEIPIQCSESRPFAFVNDLYSARMSMTNPLEANVAKWTMSALWGKLCQRDHGRPDRHPFRSLAWAGMSTSLVNAELLRVAMRYPDSVWAFGVDSILSDNPNLDWDCHGTGLGECKRSEYNGIEAYQPGLWRCLRPDGTWKEKTRGVPDGCFNWEEAAKEWQKYGSYGRVPVTWEEFVGLSSLAGKSGQWLSSIPIEMVALLRPGGMKSYVDLLKAGAGGNRSWEPLDEIEETRDFGDGYGIDHTADSAQEQIQ